MANFHPDTSDLRRGGGETRRGIPNRSTRQMKAFLARVFEQAFADPRYEARLDKEIVEGTMDARMFQVLISYYAGRPAQAVDVAHGGTVTLAEIIYGRVPKDDDDEDAEDDPQPDWRPNGGREDVQCRAGLLRGCVAPASP